MRPKTLKRPTTLEMEVAVAYYFNPRQNLIVPNVSWGMFAHEVDLCVLTPANYATEVEIKISKADLIKDKEKRHQHKCDKIKYLYFAIPEHLEEEIEHIPERAGILMVKWNKPWGRSYGHNHLATGWWSCKRIREPQVHTRYKWTNQQRLDLLRLGAMRIWGLKTKLSKALTNASGRNS